MLRAALVVLNFLAFVICLLEAGMVFYSFGQNDQPAPPSLSAIPPIGEHPPLSSPPLGTLPVPVAPAPSADGEEALPPSLQPPYHTVEIATVTGADGPMVIFCSLKLTPFFAFGGGTCLLALFFFANACLLRKRSFAQAKVVSLPRAPVSDESSPKNP